MGGLFVRSIRCNKVFYSPISCFFFAKVVFVRKASIRSIIVTSDDCSLNLCDVKTNITSNCISTGGPFFMSEPLLSVRFIRGSSLSFDRSVKSPFSFPFGKAQTFILVTSFRMQPHGCELRVIDLHFLFTFSCCFELLYKSMPTMQFLY